MTLHELDSPEALSTFASSNANVVVCFSATWCGPCTRSKPALIAMADQYRTSEPDVDVKFGIAYEHLVGNESIQSFGVRAFPTYLLLTDHGQTQYGKVEGANLERVRALIGEAGCRKNNFVGEGNSLGGGGGVDVSREDARALRLKRLDASDVAAATAAAVAATNKKTSDAASSSTEDVEMTDADEEEENDDGAKKEGAAEPEAPPQDSAATTTPTMIDPTANLDKNLIEQLTSGMGFSLVRAQKGLLYGQGNTLDGAIEWISSHQDDADIDEPVKPVESSDGGEPKVAKSYKCKETGKLFANMAQLELYAAQTGRSDFEECTDSVVPLTPEEKAKKMAELKELLKAKRAAREETEKKDNTEREKQRRFMGKEMSKTREQMDAEKRQRDAQLKRKEKNAQRQERERIRAELAKDKAERAANGGKLQGRLGVEGYNPSAIQYDKDEGGEAAAATADATKKKKSAATGAARVDECITKISAYRAGGDGGKCLKILLAYVGNVVDKDDEKFRSINMENKVYKAKVKPFLGAKKLLQTVGFKPNDDGTAMRLDDDADRDLLAATKTKLEEALVKYG